VNQDLLPLRKAGKQEESRFLVRQSPIPHFREKPRSLAKTLGSPRVYQPSAVSNQLRTSTPLALSHYSSLITHYCVSAFRRVPCGSARGISFFSRPFVSLTQDARIAKGHLFSSFLRRVLPAFLVSSVLGPCCWLQPISRQPRKILVFCIFHFFAVLCVLSAFARILSFHSFS